MVSKNVHKCRVTGREYNIPLSAIMFDIFEEFLEASIEGSSNHLALVSMLLLLLSYP